MAFFDPNDQRLITALRAGDKEAYVHIYLTYYNKLCKYVYTLSDQGKQAEDIVQDTLMSLWIKREGIKIHTSLNAYLYRAVHNTFIDRCRAENRKKTLMDELRMEAILEVEAQEETSNQEHILLLQKAIERLPKKRKKIFILNKLNNLKYKEIAAMQNISERTVETQIRKAMITIREEMERLGYNGMLPFLIGALMN